MFKKSLASVLAVSVILAGCATTGKSVSPEKEAKLKENQANSEKNSFKIIHQDKLAVGADRTVDLILRDTVPASEPELTIVKRGKTAAVNTALVATVLLGAIPTSTIRKDDFKGKVLEPKFKNPVLDYAYPNFQTWVKTNHQALSPSNKPINEVAVTAGRFVLIYAKLAGQESYQLNTELAVRFKNDWDNRTAYNHLCDIKSEAKTLETWQANNYQAVDKAVKENIQACLKELDGKKAEINKHFSK